MILPRFYSTYRKYILIQPYLAFTSVSPILSLTIDTQLEVTYILSSVILKCLFISFLEYSETVSNKSALFAEYIKRVLFFIRYDKGKYFGKSKKAGHVWLLFLCSILLKDIYIESEHNQFCISL